MPVLSGSGPEAAVGVVPDFVVLLAGTLVTLVVAVPDLVVLVVLPGAAVTVWVVAGLGLWSAQAARARAQTASGRKRVRWLFMIVGPPRAWRGRMVGEKSHWRVRRDASMCRQGVNVASGRLGRGFGGAIAIYRRGGDSLPTGF